MPVKAKTDSRKKCKESCCSDEQDTFVFLLSNEMGCNDLNMVQLRHPASGKPAYFLFTKDNQEIYEVLTFSENYRSYFIEDTVKSDGRMHITTPVDPLFLALNYIASSTHCSPLDQLLHDEVFPQTERLLALPSLQRNITRISDKRGTDVVGYKYNEDKTLSWLEKKVRRTAVALKQRQIQPPTSHAAVSNNFVKHSSGHQNTEDYLKLGCGIVCDYVSEELKEKLEKRLGLSEEKVSAERVTGDKTKRGLSETEGGDRATKKNKLGSPIKSPPSKPTPKAKSPATVSAKEKARAKAAAGSKSISSFFKKSS